MLGCVQVAVVCVLSAAGGETVLLDFYADWCGPCRAMSPLLDHLAQRGYPVRKVNIDKHPDLAARFGVRAIPCFVMLVNGREVGREVGQVPLARLEQLCQLSRRNPGEIKPAVAQGARTKDGLPIPTVQLGSPMQPSGASSSEGGNSGASAPSSSALVRPRTPEASASSPEGTASGRENVSPARLTEADLIASTVRLRVYHGNSQSCGSGTIIDARQGQALILTCGHLFRDTQGAGRIEVDLFGPNPAQKVPGRLIAWNDQRDLGLVSIYTQGPVRPARVAPVGYSLSKGLLVFSAGCNHGEDPTVRPTRIVSVNRYLGSPNLQTADQPVEGRSGGGLFTAEGYLIGVCNAADPADREGLFSSLPAIHAQLDEAQLQFVYQDVPYLPPLMPRAPDATSRSTDSLAGGPNAGRSLPTNPADSWNLAAQENPSFARSPSSEPVGPSVGPKSSRENLPNSVPTGSSGPGGALADRSLASLPSGGGSSEDGKLLLSSGSPRESPPRGSIPLIPPVDSANASSSSPLGTLSAEESSVLREIARRHREGAEVIFIVRPTDAPNAKSEIFVLNRASPGLLAQLGVGAQRGELRETSLALRGENPDARQPGPPPADPQLSNLRGQSPHPASDSWDTSRFEGTGPRPDPAPRKKTPILLPPPVPTAP